MGWINKWRDDDHITLEALLDLGGGPVELHQVAGQAGIDQRRAWHALMRLIWRGVIRYEPTELDEPARWMLTREVRQQVEAAQLRETIEATREALTTGAAGFDLGEQ